LTRARGPDIIEETTKDHSSPSFRDKGTGPMTDLSRSVEAPLPLPYPMSTRHFPIVPWCYMLGDHAITVSA